MKTEITFFLLTCFVIQVHCKLKQSREGFTFRCHYDKRVDKYYIGEDKFCNNERNCFDWEDERLGCKRDKDHFCGEGKFWCDNQCKHNITVRCNTINDCKDGTDEENCGDEIDVKNCTSADQFLCKDGLRCLAIENTCDGYCNCFDCSDENENCFQTDYDLLEKCPHSYFETANGPECFCDPNKAGYSQLCRDIKPCNDGYTRPCVQRCIQFRSKRQCSCFDGHQPVNGTLDVECLTKQNISIYYTDGYSIKMLNKNSLVTSTIVSQVANCTLLTASNDHVYYATFSGGKGSIFKKPLDKHEKPERLIETDFAITSIAVDYITNNVYFTSNGSLSVCASSGSICTQLKCCNITSVALAPKYGLMFYIKRLELDRKFHMIKSNMDGSDENIRVIYSVTTFTDEIIFFHAYETDSTIYVLEKNTELNQEYEMVNFYQQTFSSAFGYLLSGDSWHGGLRKIQRLSAFDQTAFFTKNSDNNSIYFKNLVSVFRRDLNGAFRLSVYTNETTTSSITNLYAYGTQLYDENPCNNNKSSCTGLCLLKPNKNMTSPVLGLNHSCFCDGFAPTNNNRWCSNDTI